MAAFEFLFLTFTFVLLLMAILFFTFAFDDIFLEKTLATKIKRRLNRGNDKTD